MSQNIVLTCPNCETRFSAPVAQFLPKGRQVRCSQCQHIWYHPAPASDAVEPARIVRTAPSRAATATSAAAASATATADEVTISTRKKPVDPVEDEMATESRRGMEWLTGLLWLIALLLLLAILAYVFSEPLRRAIPQAAPLLDRYTNTVDTTAKGLVGATASRQPLEWQNIHYDVKEYDGLREVLVEADLLNTDDEAQPAPKVRVRLVDASRAPLQASIIGPEDGAQTIEPGASTRYFLRIPEPPSDFHAVLLNIHEE